MNDRILYGFAAVLCACTYAYNSIKPVFATSGSGPTISLGSNPLTHIYNSCNAQNNATMMTNNSAMDFVMTDIVSIDGSADLKLDGSMFIRVRENVLMHFNTGLVVAPGQVLSCQDIGNNPHITISGYYAHP